MGQSESEGEKEFQSPNNLHDQAEMTVWIRGRHVQRRSMKSDEDALFSDGEGSYSLKKASDVSGSAKPTTLKTSSARGTPFRNGGESASHLVSTFYVSACLCCVCCVCCVLHLRSS